jgi:Na+-transporting methylmalonyl-CoA/oxaloacetate decarboxylase gamma subunit
MMKNTSLLNEKSILNLVATAVVVVFLAILLFVIPLLVLLL